MLKETIYAWRVSLDFTFGAGLGVIARLLAITHRGPASKNWCFELDGERNSLEISTFCPVHPRHGGCTRSKLIVNSRLYETNLRQELRNRRTPTSLSSVIEYERPRRTSLWTTIYSDVGYFYRIKIGRARGRGRGSFQFDGRDTVCPAAETRSAVPKEWTILVTKK